MPVMSRQQALLVAEAWQNLYANQSYVDFQSYSQDNIVNAILNYVKINYPDSFNDWTSNSEFVIKVRTLAWLKQNLDYRRDLNIRENFVQTATRRESILMLAENVFYTPNRVTGASGELRIDSISTNQPLTDSNANSLTNIEVFWNDPANADWFEQFTRIINHALTARTQFGHPLSRFNTPPTRVDLYMFNARAPSSGVFTFTANVAGSTLPFGYINVNLDSDTGVTDELPPNPINALRLLYRSDGRGSGSAGTGFFLPIRQGTLLSLDQTFSVPEPMQQVVLGISNIDNGDIFVQQLDDAGNVLLNWTKVDSLYGQGTAFNTLPSSTQTIYETHTLLNDQVRVQFGDGKFGAIPTDRFRFWYRTVNPIALVVNPSDIQKQTFVIPYVSNNALYFLTIRASVVAPITNALPTDSNDAIRGALGGSFVAQNRMVTAPDYNLFPLSDPSIKKVKTINRTYSGHSAYAKIYDPTGYYSGIKVLGEDGRLYRDTDSKSQFVSADTAMLTLDELVLQYLTPLIQASDKSQLYYLKYDEFLCQGTPAWVNTTQNAGISSGNVEKSSFIIPVGPTATDEFKYLVPGTLLDYGSLSTGTLIAVERVIADGSGFNAITLAGSLNTGTVLLSLMPPLRNQFNPEEQTAIKTNLFNLQDFGLSWNQITQSWTIIANANIDKLGVFSLEYQGDTANIQRDGSWMMYLRYVPNGGNGPEWEIIDRGLSIFVESAREVDFVYVNTLPTVDPNTGKVVQDNVKILACNEARDSLRRLGLSAETNNCCGLVYNFIADGSETCFFIFQTVDQTHLAVFVNDKLQIAGIDFTLEPDPIGSSICFFSPPTRGYTVSIRLNSNYELAVTNVIDTLTSGAQFYPVVTGNLTDSNVRLAYDGVLQHPCDDFRVITESGVSGVYTNSILPDATRLYGYAESGPTTEIFTYALYIGDSITTTFNTNCQNQTIDTVIVVIDGIMQTISLDYTLDNVTQAPDSLVKFVVAPHVNTRVSLMAAPFPDLVRSLMLVTIGDGISTQFVLPGFSHVTPAQVMVALNGVIQRVPDYAVTSNGLTFADAPANTMRIDIFVLYGALGLDLGPHDDPFDSCYVRYLTKDYVFNAVAVELTPDGYTDVDGIEVAPVDPDRDGVADDPFEFDEIVIPDGLTDLVLWRTVTENGFTVWNPIDETTVPKGTYGFAFRTGVSAGVPYDQTIHTAGDIHFDQTTDQYLIADVVSGNWLVAPIQSDYKSRIGRSGLKFIWSHYPADNTRIDPAVSNIMDMFVLSVAYDTAFRAWVRSGFAGIEPSPPTAESLQVSYSYLNNNRMTDDSLIFHPILYKPLFGTVADPALQGTFLAIKTIAATLSDNDLILRIISAIDLFFAAENWDLGESFYLTELIAFIHRALAPNLQSIVLVAKDGGPFGELFQVRSAPNELFISVAQPSDVVLTTSFTNDNLQLLRLTGQ